MRQHRAAWGFANVLLLLLVIAGGWLALTKRQDIIDWWRLSHYQAPAQIVGIADETSLSQKGRDLLYVSDPKIQDRDQFNFNCKTTAEHGRVLGCYANQSIFLFNVTDQRLRGVLQVTAVHEMLHAAYARLDVQTRDWVDSQVQAEAQQLKTDKHLQDLLAVYQQTEPGELSNELHSILATEYPNINPDLENYYKQYFTEGRSKVLALQKQYNTEFDASQARIAAYQQQLDTLKPKIDANSAELETRRSQLNAASERLDNLRASNPGQYNNEVPGYNAQVQAYNQLARATQALIVQYNSIVQNVKNEIALQTDLNQSLDSQYQPVTTQ